MCKSCQVSLKGTDAFGGAVLRVEALRPKVQGMKRKADEPDPELQTYGPAMKAKVLALAEEFSMLYTDAELLRGALGAALERGARIVSLDQKQRCREPVPPFRERMFLCCAFALAALRGAMHRLDRHRAGAARRRRLGPRKRPRPQSAQHRGRRCKSARRPRGSRPPASSTAPAASPSPPQHDSDVGQTKSADMALVALALAACVAAARG